MSAMHESLPRMNGRNLLPETALAVEEAGLQEREE